MNEADFLCKFCFEAYASQMWEQEQRHGCKLFVMAPTKGEQSVLLEEWGWWSLGMSWHVHSQTHQYSEDWLSWVPISSSSTLLFFCMWHVVYRAGCFAAIKH